MQDQLCFFYIKKSRHTKQVPAKARERDPNYNDQTLCVYQLPDEGKGAEKRNTVLSTESLIMGLHNNQQALKMERTKNKTCSTTLIPKIEINIYIYCII